MDTVWADTEDRLLARSIFGTDHRNDAESMILDWAVERGFQGPRVRSIELSVGAAVAIDLGIVPRCLRKFGPRKRKWLDYALNSPYSALWLREASRRQLSGGAFTMRPGLGCGTSVVPEKP